MALRGPAASARRGTWDEGAGAGADGGASRRLLGPVVPAAVAVAVVAAALVVVY